MAGNKQQRKDRGAYILAINQMQSYYGRKGHSRNGLTKKVVIDLFSKEFNLSITSDIQKTIAEIYREGSNPAISKHFTDFNRRAKKAKQKEKIKKHAPHLLHSEHKEKYLAYLKSPEWKNKRQLLFAERGKRCELCRGTVMIQVHHLTYERLFDEDLKDLQVLCMPCHQLQHQHDGRLKKKFQPRKS